MANLDVIAIGDTTQDVFLQMSEAGLQCDIDGTACRICFDYAEKIGVDQKTDVPASGNAPNHAIGVARLGNSAAIYTMVGNDTQGTIAQRILKENNVDTQFVAIDAEHGTNLSTIINYKSERTIFVFHEPRTYALPEMTVPRWIYLTSASGGGVEQLHEQVLAFLTQHPEVQVAFNPGTYQMKLGREKLEALLQQTDILFLNREESIRVLGVKTRDVIELIKGFHAIGVPTMVLTDGPAGAYISDGKTIWHLEIFKGPVIERTGCGDAFGSGFLSAVLQGETLEQAALWGNANSTSVVQFVGPREGLLTREQLAQMVSKNAEIVPTKFAEL